MNSASGMDALLKYAVTMLKKQETVEPIFASDEMGCLNYYVCPSCKIAIDFGDKYCRYCGRELKWEWRKFEPREGS